MASRDEPSNRTGVSLPTGDSRPPGHPGGKRPGRPPSTHPLPGSQASLRLAVTRAWARSKDEFYEAALRDQPEYQPFLATLVPGGPVYTHSIAYLSTLASEGVAGPSRWRVGNAFVVSLGKRVARVEGCLWDAGSIWESSRLPAPASFGGGPGFTASDALLVLRGGTWLVLDDAVVSVRSVKEAGPCHGF